MKMLVAKDRYAIAVMKSLGFTGSELRAQYVARALLVAALGVVPGVILANTLGELVGGALISAFGASAFRFVVNQLNVYLAAPLLLAACVCAATLLGIRDIRAVKIYEHIKEA